MNPAESHIKAEQLINGNQRKDLADEAAALIIVDGRVLYRQCLAYCLHRSGLRMPIVTFGSLGEWRQQKEHYPQASAVLINVGSRKVADSEVSRELSEIVAEISPTPVIVLADLEDLSHILKALECGAKGYIPSSICFEVCVEAINLTLAGGIYVPASGILSLRNAIHGRNDTRHPTRCTFTRRQEEVVRALGRGKANKIIACELGMSESSVKVHVRNIMRKLNARNRTEVAYKITQMVAIEIMIFKAEFLFETAASIFGA